VGASIEPGSLSSLHMEEVGYRNKSFITTYCEQNMHEKTFKCIRRKPRAQKAFKFTSTSCIHALHLFNTKLSVFQERLVKNFIILLVRGSRMETNQTPKCVITYLLPQK